MEDGFEMSEFGHTDAALDEGRVETTDVDEAIHEGATVDILTEDKKRIREQETALETYKGEILAEQWEKAEETKVDAYLKVVAARTGLLPAPNIYDEFYLGKDGRSLYLKNTCDTPERLYPVSKIERHWQCQLHSYSLVS